MAIRWTKSDYITLGKAVANFNKKIKQLEKLNTNSELIELDYHEVKQNILNRRELNRKISSLKRINEVNALKLVIDENMGIITNYEMKERKKYKTKIKKQLTMELQSINKKAFPYKTQKEMKIENIFKNLSKYKTSSLEYFSRSDLKDLRNINYYNKYLQGLEKYSNYKGYDELMAKLKNMSPRQFYNSIKDDERISDLPYQYYSHYNEVEFIYFIKDGWGIEIEDNKDETGIINDFMEFKYETSKNETIEI